MELCHMQRALVDSYAGFHKRYPGKQASEMFGSMLLSNAISFARDVLEMRAEAVAQSSCQYVVRLYPDAKISLTATSR